MNTFLRLLIALFAFVQFANGSNEPLQFEKSPVTISGKAFEFSNNAKLPTIILLVRNQDDIKASFRIATALEGLRHSYNYLIVADFSGKSAVEATAIRRTGKRFFKSSISKQHIAMEKAKDLINALADSKKTKTALVSADKKILWESPEHFKDINKLIEQTNAARSR